MLQMALATSALLRVHKHTAGHFRCTIWMNLSPSYCPLMVGTAIQVRASRLLSRYSDTQNCPFKRVSYFQIAVMTTGHPYAFYPFTDTLWPKIQSAKRIASDLSTAALPLCLLSIKTSSGGILSYRYILIIRASATNFKWECINHINML